MVLRQDLLLRHRLSLFRHFSPPVLLPEWSVLLPEWLVLLPEWPVLIPWCPGPSLGQHTQTHLESQLQFRLKTTAQAMKTSHAPRFGDRTDRDSLGPSGTRSQSNPYPREMPERQQGEPNETHPPCRHGSRREAIAGSSGSTRGYDTRP